MRTPVAVPLQRAPRKPGSRDKADPCTMVIFGGAGDLTKRKLIPAIYYPTTSPCSVSRATTLRTMAIAR
jgi:glucose-6-phosphate 1-dehydrogenase